MVTLSPTIICNEFIKRAITENIYLSPMKLQKLVYFTFGRYYAETNEKLFNEPFEVWKYGPVVKAIYDEFKVFGSNRIDKFATDAQGNAYFPKRGHELLGKFFDVFERTWCKYKNIDAMVLSEKTHVDGSPWSMANSQKIPCIPDEYIIKYFREHADE